MLRLISPAPALARLLAVVPLAMPPANTSKVPLLTRVALTEPPDDTMSVPLLVTTKPDIDAPDNTARDPTIAPESMVMPSST